MFNDIHCFTFILFLPPMSEGISSLFLLLIMEAVQYHVLVASYLAEGARAVLEHLSSLCIMCAIWFGVN